MRIRKITQKNIREYKAIAKKSSYKAEDYAYFKTPQAIAIAFAIAYPIDNDKSIKGVQEHANEFFTGTVEYYK